MMETDNDLIQDLSERKYWDIRRIQPDFSNICRVETRMEYDKETCERIINLIIRAFNMNLHSSDFAMEKKI